MTAENAIEVRGLRKAFGDVVALWQVAQRLEVLPLLDSTLPAQRDQGLSCGQYLLLAALNRAVAPTSKLQFADWYRQTALTRLLPADPAWLSAQNFWNHMDRVTADHIAACEQQISRRLIERLQLDLRGLVYDGTNFFTYINTRTPAELPQRGHNKQKRGDLRQVSLGLLVSTDFHIPLLHWVYAGNVADSVEFRSVTEELAALSRILVPYQIRRIRVDPISNGFHEAYGLVDQMIFLKWSRQCNRASCNRLDQVVVLALKAQVSLAAGIKNVRSTQDQLA